MAAITPDRVLVMVFPRGEGEWRVANREWVELQFATHYSPFAAASAADIIGGQRRHVDQLIVLGAELHDLNRAVEAYQQRPDHGGAAQLLQHLGGVPFGLDRHQD